MKKIFSAIAAFALLFATELCADELANCYDYLLAEDYDSANAACTAAAEQGDEHAQLELGWMYASGRGVAQDDAEAVRWYRAAAEQGHGFAQLELGWMYASGRGVAQNYIYAHMWWNIAAANGLGELAIQGRRRIAALLTRDQIVEAQQRAQQCMSSNYADC